MSGSISYNFDPDQIVWTISTCVGNLIVRQGKVIRMRAEVLGSPAIVMYDIQLNGEFGTTEFVETDVFVNLSTAMTDYESRLAV